MLRKLLRKRRLVLNTLVSSVLFVVFTVLGSTIEMSESIGILEELETLSEFLKGLPTPILALAIFANNFVKALLLIPSGAVFGLPPIAFIAFNGLILGVVFNYSAANLGVWTTLAGILPHGVLEIPAILMASGLALNVGWEVWMKVLGRDGKPKATIKEGLKTCLRVILPLLVVAALIEVYVTPLIVMLIARA